MFLKRGFVFTATLAASLYSFAAHSAESIKLVPNPSISANSNELVTLGLPIKSCLIDNINDIKLLDNNGAEVALFVKPLLTWHFKPTCPNSIRSVKIQFQADLSGGEKTYTFNFEGRTTANDLNEVPVSNGTFESTLSGKALVQEPRVVAIIDEQYLKASEFIPPYEPAKGDVYDDYINHQFNTYWKDFNYSTSTAANWLFDRTTTLYKYAMRSGRVDVYLEAYRSFNWWYSKLNKTGSTSNPDCKGGFDVGGKKCDQKYTYAEPIKLHLGLSGDDSQYDPNFVNDIADTAWNTSGYGAQGLKSEYTSLNRPLSERGVGLTLLTQVAAFEITGQAGILNRINSGIDNIYDHQNTANPDGLPLDGSLRHSWRWHEGEDPFLGNLSSSHSAGTQTLVLTDVADINLITNGAPIRLYRGGVINQNTTATGAATDNGNGTWSINIADPLQASLDAGQTVRWNNSDFTTIPADRGFSPWMIENVSDAMWHAYAVVANEERKTKITTYFKGAGKAIALWGITPQSLNANTRSSLQDAYSHSYVDLTNNPSDWQDGCSTTSPVLMYFGSGVAPASAVRNVSRAHEGADQHLPETILTLALASKFEDSSRAAALVELIEDIKGWFDGCQNKIAGRNIPWRSFNWQHRSNAWGTYLWTKGDNTAPVAKVRPGQPVGFSVVVTEEDTNPEPSPAPAPVPAPEENSNPSSDNQPSGCEGISEGQFCLELFDNMTLTGEPAYAGIVDSINNNWGSSSPGHGLGGDQFSARWTGTLNLQAETYRFSATTDDGMRVWVNDQQIINQWHGQAATTYTYDIELNGQTQVKVEYYDDCCDAVAQVSWVVSDGSNPNDSGNANNSGGDNNSGGNNTGGNNGGNTGGSSGGQVTGTDELQFTNVTTQIINNAPAVPGHFDIDFLDVNNDGYWDIYVGSHGGEYSALYTQKTDGSNTFEYQDPVAGNYYQTDRVDGQWLRLTGNYMFTDLNGDGKVDFTGHDADLGATGYYENITPDGQYNPLFATKSVGFPLNNDFAVLADINGDGNIDAVENQSFDADNQENRRRIIDFQTKEVLYPAITNASAPDYGNDRHYGVADLNHDSWPDIFAPEAGGYWSNNNGSLVWQESWSSRYDGKKTMADFDSDGDLDIVLARIQREAAPEVYVATNDGSGSFSLLSGNRGLTFNGTLHDIYGDHLFADINNDGLLDYITAGEDYKRTVRIYLNAGNMNFVLQDTNFGGYEGGWPHVAVIDYDNDGDLDILKTHDSHSNTHHSLAIWRNDSNLNGNHWLSLKIRGKGNNTEGMHTYIIAYKPGTNEVITSFYTQLGEKQNAMYPHLGLGSNVTVDLEVRFPHGGPVHKYSNIQANQTVLVYHNGTLVQGWERGDAWPLVP